MKTFRASRLFSFVSSMIIPSAALCLLLLSQGTWSATFNVPFEYPTIQSAIDAASTGDWVTREFDTILVAPGTYQENLTILDKTVVLKSTDGPDVTIIDGGNVGRVLTIRQSANQPPAASPTIEGFTLTNGNSISGGGVYVIWGDPTFRDVVITGNMANYGGGVYAGLGTCFIVFEDSVISDNAATYQGGGIYGVVSCTSLRNSQLVNNRAGLYGGGAVSFGFCTGFAAFDSVISGNTATERGGALYTWGSSRCGAGVTVRNTTVSDNQAQNGGAVYVGSNAATRSLNALVVRNTADYGGGIYVASGGMTNVDFSTIADNTAPVGGGFFGAEDVSLYRIANSIVYHNATLPVLPTASTSPSLFYQNVIGGSDVEGCVSGDYLGWETDICADPLLVDLENGDYSLSPGSPAIDMAVSQITLPDGSTLPLTLVDEDLDGNARPEGDGYDMGAYEFSLPLLQAEIDVDPDTLNLKSKGQWITVYIALPDPYDVADVLLPSVFIGHSIPAVRGEVQGSVLMLKFDRTTLASHLAGEDGSVELSVSGQVGSIALFQGVDQIRVRNLKPNPLKGAERIQAIGAM